MAYSLAQQTALALLPKITGFCSLIGSALIVWTVARDPKKRQETYHRLVCGISFVDISSSFWLGLSTWPIPAETGALWAVGTTASCNTQGFFTQFGISSSFYNASLSMYYLLVIRYGWKEDRIRRIEPYMHVIPILWGLATAIAGLPLTLFNNANLWCWIASYPQGCDNSSTTCLRGANADIFRWAFFYGPLWCMILIVTINVILIFLYVRKIELSAEPYRFSVAATNSSGDNSIFFSGRRTASGGQEGPQNNRATRSQIRGRSSSMVYTKQVAHQCFWYAAAFYLNWTALTLVRLIQTINEKTYFPILLIASMTTPIQGLPNFIVYLGPKYRKLKQERPNAGVWGWLKGSLEPEQPSVAHRSSVAEDNSSP